MLEESDSEVNIYCCQVWAGTLHVLEESDREVNIYCCQVWAGTLHVLEESDSEQHRYVDMVFPHENYNDASLSVSFNFARNLAIFILFTISVLLSYSKLRHSNYNS